MKKCILLCMKTLINTDKVGLRICLGAQLIGEVLSAKCERSSHKEINIFEITLIQHAKGDSIFSKIPQSILCCSLT